jgi:dTDP-4-dehydrorhamnose reductase
MGRLFCFIKIFFVSFSKNFIKMNILVTGANGQLGTCLRVEVSEGYSNNAWFFTDHSMVDITNYEDTKKYIIDNKIDIVVNCAAYTNVEKAE